MWLHNEGFVKTGIIITVISESGLEIAQSKLCLSAFAHSSSYTLNDIQRQKYCRQQKAERKPCFLRRQFWSHITKYVIRFYHYFVIHVDFYIFCIKKDISLEKLFFHLSFELVIQRSPVESLIGDLKENVKRSMRKYFHLFFMPPSAIKLFSIQKNMIEG